MAGKLPGRALDPNTAITVNNISFGSNLAINASAISVGNSTVNTSINSTAIVGNGALITSVNAATLEGNTVNSILVLANIAANILASAAYTNAVAYSGNAVQAYTNATSYADTKAATAYSNSTSYSDTKAATAYSNATSYADTKAATAYSNATSYSDTVAATAFSNAALRADAAYTNAASYADTKAATAYSNATSYADTKAATAYSNATSYADTVAATAFTNAASRADNAYTNAASYADTKAATAYSNATSYADTKVATAYSNATSYADTKAATAYSNAIAYSGNAAQAYTNAVAYAASNTYVNSTFLPLAGGTLTGNLVINAGANVVANLAANNLTIRGDVQIDGNLVVSGIGVIINATSLAIEDNMIYLNNGSQTSHPDLGFAGNYNDGGYKHAGFFRDASDGIWKVFDSYTPEPDATAFIDTTNNTFRIASFQANVIVANSFTGNGTNITSVNAATVGGNTAATLRSYSDTVAATAYSNGTTYSSNADNISSGTLNTARLPATVNVSTAINVGANVNLSTTQINVGNSTVNTVITSTSITGNGANITSVNAATVGGNTASTLRSYSDTVAATAFSNAAARADSAYSNAIAYSGNATNISSGTIAFARLPALYLGTTQIQSTSAAQAVSGITTLVLRGSTPILTVSSSNYLISQYPTTLGVRNGAEGFLILGNNGQNEIRAGRTVAGGYLDFYVNNTVDQASASDGNYIGRMHASGIFTLGTSSNTTLGGFTNTRLGIKQIADGGVGGGIHIEQNSTDNIAFFGFSGEAFRIGTSYRVSGSYQPIEILTSGTSRVFIAANGNVGVGTTTPGNVLDVSGRVAATGFVGPVATFLGSASSATATAIVTNNSGYVGFDSKQNTDSSVFETVGTGSYGVKIKKAGYIYFCYNQDVITTGSTGYLAIQWSISGGTPRYQLITHTNGQWDSIWSEGCWQVSANDTLEFYINSGTDLTAMDPGDWSYLSILWIGS